jgi:hypothetical protein
MRAVLLLLLAGCSSATDPIESGAVWLLELPEDAFPPDDWWPGLATVLEEPLRHGRAFPWGEQGLQRLFRAIKQNPSWVRERERFTVVPGKELKIEIPGAFALRFTTTPVGTEEQSIAYTFAWTGGTPVSGVHRTSDRGCFAFAAPREGGRIALLVVVSTVEGPEDKEF